MFVLFGGGAKSKNPDGAAVPYFCESCGSLRIFGLLENYRYGHVYGIRVAKWNTQRWLECLECRASLPIPDSQAFNEAKAISLRWNQINGDSLTEGQVYFTCGQVAESVLRDSQAAVSFFDLVGDQLPPQSTPAEIVELPIQPGEPVFQPEGNPISDTDKYCPKCEMEESSVMKFCPECGTALVAIPSASLYPDDWTKYCNGCNLPRPEAMSFCPECGEPLKMQSMG